MTTKLFGEPVRRREDARLIIGKGRYLDDIGHHALAAAFVRSPHAHARITDIDVEAALDVEGLVAIYTYEDLHGPMAEPLPVLIPHPQLHSPRTGYPLANGIVNHVGEPIAMVVAIDRYIAEDAAERIAVSYEELPVVVGVDAAREAAHWVHEDVPSNVAAHHHQETGDVEPALAASPHTLSFTQYIERSACTPMEGKGVHARWDPDDGSLRVYTSTQASTSVRAAIAAKLQLSLDKVEVIAPDVGGGFGVKIVHPWPEELLVPMAAIALQQEVKWAEDRREHFISSAHERQQKQEITVGFTDEGRITALDVHIWHDNGAYTPYGIIVPIVTATQLVGPYVLPVYRVIVESVYTNTVIVTPYRGAGRPQGCYAMERTMDRIADELGLDRALVRERNLIQPDQFPYDHHLTFQDGRPVIYDSGDYPGLMAKLKTLVGWDDVETLRAEASSRGKQLGIGMALYVEGTGPGPYEGGHVQVLGSGKVLVSTGLTSQGQGHETVFAQIVASELGVPIEDIEVTTGDTRRFGYAVGTFASRAAVMSGNAIALAARGVKEKALRIAADVLEASPDDLEIDNGVVQVKGVPGSSVPLRTVAVLSNPLRYAFDEAAKQATQFAIPGSDDKPPVAVGDAPGLEHRDYYSPIRSTFASGAHAAIVEIDPQTWEIDVVKYAVVHDCGNVVNPMIVEGQVHGGVAQGVGGALYERMAYDKDGQLQNASFMDFLMPYASEVPEIDIDHQQTPSPLNPLGIKGAGEAGVIPGTAAIASAIEDAVGRRIAAMPISPTELYDLVRNPESELTATAGRRAGTGAMA
ncbi:xanthine dehydrogenase family protein molybdopterin-binding subunit [Blastococcus sp. CT_GayMR20]|uniref:aerobic carbon-monoxide dehydrogenase large subunit n=1 Tax=Blastococcus sp. CT_GayMR20 TaxID=2559609 RepID=UPI0010735494|nr:aerobic carbon-monoxide dehydrogenase large subunit [Blastococcus sp. CT_GayMR20]TFV90194.1 xanthine dehydrogenase family protein molybdopterin-binding subunit [Blastococcus sp. CT_GayMR20]TFV90201.1 xanthine dehydrogenase family protein molybdopterin-binding subunit [Blastococcus sp. CT_GayMR20]